MPSNSKKKSGGKRDVAQTARLVLGVLLGLNVIAAGLVLYPPGGSAESLQAELASLQAQIAQGRARLEETRQHAVAVEGGLDEGNQFLGQYFLGQRVVYSALVEELTGAAGRAGITDRGNAYTTDLIDGSDTLGMMTITANFEGTYRNLLNFIREIDRSPSLLIIESLTAAPQPDSDLVTVSLRMNAFVQQEAFPFPVQTEEGTLAENAPAPVPTAIEGEPAP